MIINSMPDLLSFQRQNRINSDLKTKLEITSREAVTGRREDVAGAVNGDIGGVFLLEKALADIDQDQRINAVSGARIDIMSSALNAVRGTIGTLDVSGLAALSVPDEFGIGTIAKQADANLRSIMGLLSTKHGDRNLFSGGATDTLPLSSPDQLLADVQAIMQAGTDPSSIDGLLDTYFNDPEGGFAANIYRGGVGQAPPSFLEDGSKIEYGIKADDQALRDTLRGLAVMATASGSGFDLDGTDFATLFTGGISTLSKGVGGVIKLEAGLGITAKLLEDASTRQSAERVTLGLALNAVLGRDQFEAASELKQLQSQLEASYLITARLANLSLTNFIR